MENKPSQVSLARRLHNESPQLQYSPEELHARLIDFENQDLLYEDEDHPTIAIVEDTVVEVQNVRMKLTPTKVFILNALRLSQGYSQTRAEMMDLGFHGTNSPFISGISELAKALENAGGAPFIEQKKAHKTPSLYTLLPEVQIVDQRKGIDPWQKFLRDTIGITNPGEVTVLENGAIDFVSARARVAATVAMIRDNEHIVDINLLVAKMLGDRIGERSEAISTLPASNNGSRITPEEADNLMQLKEDALLAYLSSQNPSDDQKEVIRQGISAAMELFVRNLDLPYMLSRKFHNNKVPFSDLYQEGTAELLDMVFATGVNESHDYSFRYIAGERIRRHHDHGILPLIEAAAVPVSVPIGVYKQVSELSTLIDDLTKENGVTPSATRLSEKLGTQVSTVMGLLALRLNSYTDAHLDDAELAVGATSMVDDLVDAELDRIERQDAMTELFRANMLLDKEKIILSLYYKIFHRSLGGAEYKADSNEVFTYPHDQEVFDLLASTHNSISSIGVLLADTPAVISRYHKQALRKARTALTANVAFDEYAKASPLEAQAKAEQEDSERQDLVNLALELSPSKRMGKDLIQAFFSDGSFPASPKRVAALFGSLPAFQEACGFRPRHYSVLKDVSNQDLVNLALEIRPLGPLSIPDLAELSKNGKFVSYGTIRNRFGNMTEFHRQCGFTT